MVGLSVRLGVLGVAREQIHQLRVHEEFFPAERLSAQHADRYQRLEIAGSGLATGDFRIDEIRYAAVGLLENDVHQFAAVDLGKSYVAGGDTSRKRVVKFAYLRHVESTGPSSPSDGLSRRGASTLGRLKCRRGGWRRQEASGRGGASDGHEA